MNSRKKAQKAQRNEIEMAETAWDHARLFEKRIDVSEQYPPRLHFSPFLFFALFRGYSKPHFFL
jgi:hypothetical protein